MDREEYLKLRKDMVQSENLERTGGHLILSAKEKTVDIKLRNLKQTEIEMYRKDKDGRNFPPAVNFLKSKANIESSEVFKFLKSMPKGAALHVHDMASASIDWVISHLTYHSHCYMCRSGDGIRLAFFGNCPSDTELKWKLVSEARAAHESVVSFDAILRDHLSMMTDKQEVFASQGDIWAHFQNCFMALYDLFFSEVGFEPYITQALKEFYEDNVQYVEMRSFYADVSRLDGSSYDTTWLVEKYIDISDKFVKSHQDFLGMKNIFSAPRMIPHEALCESIQLVHKWKQKYPKQIIGYDLVAHEDPGNTLLHYVDQLLTEVPDRQKLPYFFHAGETNWIGQDVDCNLIDAVLLNSTRIGHGYAIAHHPQVLQAVRQKDIAIELNPASNQVLGLVSDLRNHPGVMLMAMGMPVIISSDDPPLWGASGLSYDFYLAFMGFTGGWGDLATLKELAINSIKYSGLDDEDKHALMAIWQKKWDIFIDEMIELYHLDDV